MICRTDISNLKTDILEKVGQKIIVKGSLGRSRTFEKEATIEKAYPNIFVGEAYSPLIPPQVEMKRKKAEVLV